MFNTIKHLIREPLKQALASKGLVLLDANNTGLGFDKAAMLRIISNRGATTILDVGANEGQFVQWLREAGFTGKFVSFEPQPEPFLKLVANSADDDAWECHNIGLSDKLGRMDMHISNWSVSSSLLPIGQHHLDIMPGAAEIRIVPVDVMRLDDWAEERRLLKTCGKLFLKIDVQGYEMPVLLGCPSVLHAVDGVLVELNFTELYDGQSKYYDVMRLLEEVGLKFVGLFDPGLDAKTREVLWADGLFLRS